MICKGAHKISEDYHDAFKHEDMGFRWTVSALGPVGLVICCT